LAGIKKYYLQPVQECDRQGFLSLHQPNQRIIVIKIKIRTIARGRTKKGEKNGI
jgi:hypothetical protein